MPTCYYLQCCSHTHTHHKHIILVWTSQYSVFCIQIVDIQTALTAKQLKIYSHLLAHPQPRFSQLLKDSFNVRPTSHQLLLCVKSPNLATSTARTSSPSLPTYVISVPRIPHRQQQQAQESEPATKSSILIAEECSSPTRLALSTRIDSWKWIVNCRSTSSMRIDSCRWIVSCRWISSMRIDSCRWIVSYIWTSSMRIDSCERLFSTQMDR